MIDRSLSNAATLNELILFGKENNYGVKDVSTFTKIGDDLIIAGGYMFDRYIYFIRDNSITIKLTNKEYLKYKYHPKRLCYDLYKTEELYLLLLKLNNISSELEFTNKKIKVLHPNKLSILNKILLLTEDEINENHTDLLVK